MTVPLNRGHTDQSLYSAENQIIMHLITVMHGEEINEAQTTQDSEVYGSVLYNVFTIKKRKTNLVLNSYVLKNVLLVFVLVFCGYIFFKFSEPKNAV